MNTPECTSQTKAPFGSWKSPISSDLVVSKTTVAGITCIDGNDYYWQEFRPHEAGRYVIVKKTNAGQVIDAIPPGFNCRSRVHEYGGGAYTVADGVIYFSNDEDQRVYRQEAGGTPTALTSQANRRFADFIVDRRRNRLICVQEDHSIKGTEPINTICTIDIWDGSITPLISGADFYSNPRLSPDGMKLSFVSWNHPNMPWDESKVSVATFDDGGGIEAVKVVAGGKQESIFQPEWSPDGTLYFISDRSGFWNFYRHAKGTIEPVYKAAFEFGMPQWKFGFSLYSFVSPNQILCTYTKHGTWRLAGLNTKVGELESFDLPYSEYLFITSVGKRAVFRAGSATQPYAIYELDLSDLKITMLSTPSNFGIDQKYFSVPEAIDFPTENGQIAHAFYYPPENGDFSGPDGAKPPLLVKSHGGPTGAASQVLDLTTQYWTSRGFAVLDVNYGGSTGFGRPYRERLKGNWGIIDVDDCLNGARYLVQQNKVDGNKLAITGGSAGGYTTLSALTFRDTFRAGSSHFGISDLESMARDTHKFESRYLEGLVGKYPEQRSVYMERSPIHHVDKLSCPVAFFQGLEDKVVPPNQAQMMVDALREKKLPVAYVTFAGEQHGFRKASTIKRALDGEFYFYSQIFNFKPADDIEPLEIENLTPQVV
jgi:dipeptidyl aminopeptidase/acylaminoacyl peptidase